MLINNVEIFEAPKALQLKLHLEKSHANSPTALAQVYN